MSHKLLTLGELADATGLPVGWIKREADGGRIPCLRVGSRRMFDLSRVRDVLDQRAAINTKGVAL